VGAVWMHPSAPASCIDCGNACSLICIRAVLHIRETDSSVLCILPCFNQ